MKTHDLIQGSPEWKAHRAAGFNGLPFFNASDAPAMMGCSPYKTRAQLLREMHTGLAPEVDIATQKRFDNGHRAEALARPLAEKIVGEDLYPVTGSLGRLSASFDGLTLDERQGFEHKALNADLRAAFDAMTDAFDKAAPNYCLPIYHRVQMEQQLHVSGAERVLFMASEWTADGELVEERHCWYYPDDELRGAILAGWAQFERDLAAYTVPDAAEPAAVGRAPETLPALRIEVTGAVTASNLAEFKDTALATIRSVNRTLATDQDFADAEKAVKWCADVEGRVKAAKEHALSQTATIDALFKALDDISAEARTVRLDLDKLVTRRKVEVKEQAVTSARKVLDAHVATLNAELAPMRLQPVAVDFAGAIKGLRTVASLQDALDTTLAKAKIEADNQARGIRANVAAFKAQAEGMEFLFADLGQIVHKAADDFVAVLQARIATHRAAEAEKARKAAEAEAARIAAAEQRAREQEAARIAAEATRSAAQQSTTQPGLAGGQVDGRRAPERHPAGCSGPGPQDHTSLPASPPPAARADEPATLKLGDICGRLGFIVRGDFLADTLHVKPARTERGIGYYSESQFVVICHQLRSHVAAMVELYAGEPA
jgi:predicted phage-related endonuclease